MIIIDNKRLIYRFMLTKHNTQKSRCGKFKRKSAKK